MKLFGLRAKFIALLTSLFLVLSLSLAFFLIRQNTATLRTNLNQDSKSFAELATKPIGDSFVLYKDSGSVRITQQTENFYELDHAIESVAVIDTTGKVLYRYGSEQRSIIPVSADNNFNPHYAYNDGVITQITQPFIEDFGGHRYSLVYGISRASIDHQIAVITWLIVGITASLLLVSIVVAFVVFNHVFIAPVRRVSRLASVISAGNYGQQITTRRRDEIGELSKSVNTMAEALKSDIFKLQETDRLKNEFMMITSHNLRTPLSIIKGYLEVSQEVDEKPEMREVLKNIEANTIRLSEFAEDVLTIATIEDGEVVLGTRPTMVKPIIDKVANEFRLVTNQKHINFNFENNLGEQQSAISTPHLRSALWNLLDNAYKFTEDGNDISLYSEVLGDQIVLRVSDTGTGISPEEQQKLFTKFHRGTDTMRYDYEGVGIGLYLTKLIIEEFKGTVSVNSEVGVGSTFTISIPIVATA